MFVIKLRLNGRYLAGRRYPQEVEKITEARVYTRRCDATNSLNALGSFWTGASMAQVVPVEIREAPNA